MFADLNDLEIGDAVHFQPVESDQDVFEVSSFLTVHGRRIKATAKQRTNPSNTVSLELWQKLDS